MKPLATQTETLRRGIVEIVPEEEFIPKLEKSVKTNTPLRIKLGVDPTAPDIHLGFTVVMRKIRQFQDLGHQAVLLIGDYTATIGDPTGKDKTRALLTHEQVLEHAKTYQDQFFQIVDKEKCEVVYNGDWFRKLNAAEVIQLASQMTVAQMLEREDFKERYTSGKSIGLHEFLYPLMQGYDSVVLKSDVEIGGTDQKFNVLVGRDLQKTAGQEPQIGLFMPILLGTDGKEKMSKSLGNYIGINESAQSMLHKLINLPDQVVPNYYELLTDVPIAEIHEKEKSVKSGSLDPRTWKAELARNITAQYHGEEKALAAEQEEKKVHAGNAVPEDTPVIEIAEDAVSLVDLIADRKLLASKGEARRLIKNRGIALGSQKVEDPAHTVSLDVGMEVILKIGKRGFYRLQRKA